MPRFHGPRAASVLATAATTLTLVSAAPSAHAQSWRDRIKSAAKGTIDQATNGGAKKPASADSAGSSPSGGSAASTAGSSSNRALGSGSTSTAGDGAWANYDFKPGEKTLFTDDFSNDVVGNFPRRFQFTSGSAEIVEWQGKRWLSTRDNVHFRVPLGQMLPQRYTIEFDMAGGHLVELSPDPRNAGERHPANTDWFQFYDWFAGIKGDGRDATTTLGYNLEQTPPVHVAIQVDGDYAKAYVNERRVTNVPNARLTRSNTLYFDLDGDGTNAAVRLANLRVMAGGRALYDALSTSGRVATQGIYFATGSDQLRPESVATLQEIGTMLADHPELKLTIEGHTDNVGDGSANQALSQQRADAVKQALVTTYHVDASRLTSKGMGATKPVVPNTTAEGRQTNRRVELVRQ